MSKGVLLFAFNSPTYNYYDMAVATAKRINHFLNLPVTVVTDEDSISGTYSFDNTVIVEPDRNNIRSKKVWINKGRYQAYELSPYDETILLDTDYMVNSDKLLRIFDYYDDFCCHDKIAYLMQPQMPAEFFSPYSHEVLWATVVAFKKTNRAKQVFDCIKMVQENFNYYGNLHGYLAGAFRNDYALTIALRIANGHCSVKQDFIPWKLVHTGYSNIKLYRNTDTEFNTEYTVMFENMLRGKVRKEYITIKDFDFHMIDKDNFMELV